MKRSAVISKCGQYRFLLERSETPLFNSKGTALFVLNNCSKADADIDDPTVRRGWGYTRAWDYHRMLFANTNPHRSTDPDSAVAPPESILLENDDYLRRAAVEADLIVCAWGVKAKPELVKRAMRILNARRVPMHVLALSKDGVPKHPLYLRKDAEPQIWLPELPKESDPT